MKKNLNELLFAIYLFLFAICKIFIKFLTNYSTLILFGSTLVILIIAILYNIKEKQQRILINKNFIFIVAIIILLFLITIIFNNNIYVSQYLYEFLIYGIFSMYLCTNVKNYKKFLEYYADIAVFVILVYCLDPFNNFYFFSDYMSFGLTCMLPAFCASCIGRKIFKRKIYLIFEIFAFLEIILFCNRGAILVAIIFEISLYLTTTKLSIKKITSCTIGAIIGIVVMLNIENILLQTINYLNSHNLESYSIRALYNMVSGENTGLSGRDTIWKNAINYFQENWIFGHGIGSFQSEYGGYTHNIFLEILTSYGIVGMIIFIALVLVYFYKIYNSIGDYRITLIMFFIMGIFPLLLSIYTFKWQYFWVFIIMSTKEIPKEYRKTFKEEKKNAGYYEES